MNKNCTPLKNRVDQMPLHNRSLGQKRPKDGGDIALATHKKQVYLEREIKSDDTLQSIALEFNVSVAELKRINNLHKENEIYARKVLKVPSNPFSLLLEKEYFFENEKSQEKWNEPVKEHRDEMIETINNSNCAPLNSNEGSSEKEEEKFVHLFPGTIAEEKEESMSLLLSTAAEHSTNEEISCNGADWGISWPTLILLTVVLGVGGPVLYVFWFLWGRKEKIEGS